MSAHVCCCACALLPTFVHVEFCKEALRLSSCRHLHSYSRTEIQPLVGTMSEHVRTRPQSSERGNDEEPSQLVGPAIVQQPTEEKRQQEEPPTETQGIAPSGEIENEGAPAVQGPDVEAVQQDLALFMIEDDSGDGPDVKEGILPTFDPTKMLEAGLDVQALQQDLALLMIEDASGDGPDVEEGILPTFDPTKMLEGGDGQPEV
ncbi:putative G antigen family E member 3 isoform X2 [Callithrix jacchus]